MSIHQQIAKLERQLANLTPVKVKPKPTKKVFKAQAKPVAKPESKVDLAQIERLKVLRDRNRAAMEIERAQAELERAQRVEARRLATEEEIAEVSRELNEIYGKIES